MEALCKRVVVNVFRTLALGVLVVGCGTGGGDDTPVGGGGGSATPASIGEIVAGGYHSLAVRDDGTVMSWGSNFSGQLGHGDLVERRLAPRAISGLTGVSTVAAGGFHSLALTSDGTVLAWGANTEGQLGLVGSEDRRSPVPVPGLSGISHLAAGDRHTLALLVDGSVLAWGDNTSGELGRGFIGGNSSAPAPVPGLSRVVAIAAGAGYSAALLADGTLRTWGKNTDGQLGLGDTIDRSSPQTVPGISAITAFAAGSSHVLALSAGGSVFSWGRNWGGQLGIGSASFTPVSTPQNVVSVSNVTGLVAGGDSSFALLDGGGVKAWGYPLALGLGSSSEPVTVPESIAGLPPVDSLAAGYMHTLAVSEYGVVRAWGGNSFGQLGVGNDTDSYLPQSVVVVRTVLDISAGEAHSLIGLDQGVVYACGSNIYGQIGFAGGAEASPKSINDLASVIDVAAGSIHSIALSSDGRVSVWGGNGFGQLGLGSEIGALALPTVLPGVAGVKAVFAGEAHSMALRTDGTVLSWGKNDVGQLGLGTTWTNFTPVAIPGVSGVVSMDASNHTLALLGNGRVMAWGNNADGQLGLGYASVFVSSPSLVPGLTGVVAVAAGARHSMFLMSDGRVKTCGWNGLGQLGTGDLISEDVPVVVPGLTGVERIAAGLFHSCALSGNGMVKVWGSNSVGQLGLGDTTNRSSPVMIPKLQNVELLEAGDEHTLALTASGVLSAWGNNSFGQLGIGSVSDYETLPSIVGDFSGLSDGKWLGRSAAMIKR